MSAENKEITTADIMKEIQDPYIKKAFEYGAYNIMPMTVMEFIKVVGYPIDKFMIDNFYYNLNDDIPIYVTNDLIEWCGFNGKDFEKRKELFIKFIKGFEEGKDYFYYSNTEYNEYYNSIPQIQGIETTNSPQFPAPSQFAGKNKTKHLILTVNCFKEILMMLNTKKAKEIRTYYISLEKLIKIYMKYQLYQQKFQTCIVRIANAELHDKLDNITKTNQKLEGLLDEMREEQKAQTEALEDVADRLNTAANERAPRTQSPDKHSRFVLIELNAPTSPWKFYVIRAQRNAAKTARKAIKDEYPNSRTRVKITYQPNAINLFNLIKERLRTERRVIGVCGNFIRLRGNYTSDQFVEDVRQINESRMEV